MNEIYWITRLDGFRTVITVLLVISIITIIASLIFIGDYYFSDQYCKSEKEKKVGIKGLKIMIPIFIVTMFTLPFIPSTKDMFLIYGIGGTIDYIKNNPKAKNIPDKCIDALDKWVEELTPEEVNKN